MSDSTTIKLSPGHQSEFEFTLTVDGTEETNRSDVRLVIVSKSQGCNYSIPCSKVKGTPGKWMARIPALKHITEASTQFKVEVIIDGYFFEAASGTAEIIQAPTVEFAPVVVKEVSKPRTPIAESIVRAAIREATPINQLDEPIVKLEPVAEPADPVDETLPEMPVDEVDIVDDGEGDVPAEDIEAVLTAADAILAQDQFNPRGVAEGIMRETLGSVAMPVVKGSLFKRDASGAPVVAGFSTPEQEAAKAANAAKVRNILKR